MVTTKWCFGLVKEKRLEFRKEISLLSPLRGSMTSALHER